MALEAEKRNLLLFFGLLACILIGTQMWSYTRISTAGMRMTSTGVASGLDLSMSAGLPNHHVAHEECCIELQKDLMPAGMQVVSRPPGKKAHLALHSRQDNLSPWQCPTRYAILAVPPRPCFKAIQACIDHTQVLRLSLHVPQNRCPLLCAGCAKS